MQPIPHYYVFVFSNVANIVSGNISVSKNNLLEILGKILENISKLVAD